MMYKKGLTLLIAVMITVMLSPFCIYADTQIVPTYSSSAQTWVNDNGYVYVTNYCEGTSASTNSCKLTFTLNSNWYGMIYIDGYDSSNTQWINYQPVFIADGQGEYNYNFWQSGQKVISKVTVLSINLVKPNSSVDLTQIIQLLTAIESDTSSIDITLDNTLSQITNVLNQLIISNGYLETLTKLKQWNIAYESYYINSIMLNRYSVVSYQNIYDLNYPVFSINAGSNILPSTWFNAGVTEFHLIMNGMVGRSAEEILQNDLDTSLKIKSVQNLNFFYLPNNTISRVNYVVLYADTSGNYTINIKRTSNYMFIWGDFNVFNSFNNLSTDFALKFGLNNRLLNYLDVIANGTSATQSAAVDSQTANSQLETSSNQLFTQEDNFKSDMNNAMSNIPSFSVNNFGNKFMSSATWVRQQYERMTNNTPFQQVITFSLLVGLSMILIGKVRK